MEEIGQMITHPTVSIVLPVYNGEAYLGEAIESVMAQTYASWELIIVDDCSTDLTPVIANAYAEQDDRIRVVRNEVNKKLPASLNVGFSQARGKYFTWISDDNRFGEEALAIMAGELDKNPHVDVVYCNMQWIDENGSLKGHLHTPQQSFLIYFTNVIMACFMYRRDVDDALGGYDESLFLVEDYDFWLRAYRSFKFKHVDANPYFYRTHEGALTQQRQLDIRERTCRIIDREYASAGLGLRKRALALAGTAVHQWHYAKAKRSAGDEG